MRVRNENSVSTWSRCVLTPTSASEQEVLAVVVLDPALVEEHVRSGEPELVGQLAGTHRHAHLGHVRVRMLHPEEVQAHFRHSPAELVDRAEQRERVEPVVDAAAPEHDLVVVADAGHDASEHGARVHAEASSLTPNGDDVNSSLQALAVVVRHRVDPADRGELAEPEVALLLARAQEKSPRASCSFSTSVDDRTTSRRVAAARSRACSSCSRWNGS